MVIIRYHLLPNYSIKMGKKNMNVSQSENWYIPYRFQIEMQNDLLINNILLW